jgi:hypothetical protein
MGLTNKSIVTPTTVFEEQESVTEVGTLFEVFSAVIEVNESHNNPLCCSLVRLGPALGGGIAK